VIRPKTKEENRSIKLVCAIHCISQIIKILAELSAGFIYQRVKLLLRENGEYKFVAETLSLHVAG